jgi:hypothetical protein
VRTRASSDPTSRQGKVDLCTYLYRAVDSAGATIDFLLAARRHASSAKRLLSERIWLLLVILSQSG